MRQHDAARLTEMKKFLKWLGISLLALVLMVAALVGLLYFPPFQNWAAGKVAEYASEQTGMDIKIEHVGLSFPLDLSLKGLHIEKPNDSIPNLRDTIADARELVVDVKLLPLLKKQVEIDALRFSDVKINTDGLIHTTRISGNFEQLNLESHGIDLTKKTIRVDSAMLAGGNINIELADTVPEDTTASDNRWKINADKVKFERSKVAVHLPGDTMSVKVAMDDAVATNYYMDFYRTHIKVGNLKWKGGGFNLDYNYDPPSSGVDYSHLALTDVSLEADSFDLCMPKIDVSIKNSSFREKSGVDVRNFTSHFSMDAKKIYLPDAYIETSESKLKAHFVMDQNTFSETVPGKMHLTADGYVGKQDLMQFVDMPAGMKAKWPAQPLKINTVLAGNMRRAELTGLVADLPTAFHVNGRGTIENLDDLDNLRANFDANATAYNLDFITAALPKGTMDGVNIPRGIGIKGNFGIDGDRYRAKFSATEGKGTLAGTADINTAGTMTYTADLTANNLNLDHFLPKQDLGTFSGKVKLKGNGTDIYSPKTRIDADVDIKQFAYGGYDLSGMGGTVRVANGHGIANVKSNNPLIKGNVNLDALLGGKQVKATIGADLTHVDFYKLKLSDTPLSASFCTHLDIATDKNEYYRVVGTVSDLVVQEGETGYFPDDINIDLLTRRDTTHLVASNGDFYIDMDASGGYKVLLKQMDKLVTKTKDDFKVRKIDQMGLRELLPTARIKLNSGSDNFVSRVLQRYGYSFDAARMDLTSSPETGLNGDVEVHRLLADSMQLDTVRLTLFSDDTQLRFNGQVRNNNRNPQYVFNTLFNGYLQETGATLNVRYYDQKDVLGIRLGAVAEMQEHGIKMRLLTDDPIIGYKKFDINKDNYVFLSDDKRVSARLRMRSDDGVDVQVYSDDDNTEALQDLTLSISKLKIEDIVAVIPYMPQMSGTLDGDYHFIQTPENITVGSTMNVKNMTYDGDLMGNLGTEFVYMPKDDGSHYVDAIIYSDDKEVATVVGTYRSEGDGYLDAKLEMDDLPMTVLNGFIPDQIVGFEGVADGNLDIRGQLSKPHVDGTLVLDTAYLVSEPYGMRLRLDTTPIQVKGSKVNFKNFNLYSTTDNPLVINGDVNFADLDKINLNIRLAAKNFMLINSKEQRRSEAYGKAYVDIMGFLRGSLDYLRLRGRMDVLGTTDMSYILRDTPLTVDYQMDELVRFTDFTDTTQTVVKRSESMGFDMDMTVNIDRAARIVCYLKPDHTNYVDLMGDGSLRLQYTPADNFKIRGKYTLNNGEMKYSMQVIPLRTFKIQDGSYIEFMGDPMNPRLNITATERVKSSVSTGEQSRSVDFDCGVVITKTLQEMGLQFIISAPTDMTVQNELNTLSEEERAKLAVAMLTTRMYMSGGSNTEMSVNNALSSFIQNEINNIAGNALRTLDFSLGFDNSFDATGAMHTDYSFRFAKRFWNNRLRVVVGGTISTGSNVPNRNQAFFDNVSLEYRLSQTSNKYLKLFYSHDAYDWLEGENSEYGAGFMWKRKVNHFSELFHFKNDDDDVLDISRMRRDTVRQQTDSVTVRENTNNSENEKKQ